MRLKGIFIVLVLVLLISQVSCTRKTSTSVTEVNYRRGTSGVEISFNPNTPSKVYEGNTLNILVDVENKGAYPHSDTFEGYLILSGPTTAAINVGDPRKSLPVDLQGRSYDFPDGTKETIRFEARNVRVPGDAETYKTPVQITSCYRYQTLATPTICIDPNPYETIKTVKACTVREHIPIDGGQGGPVVVSSIEESVSRNYITFRIKISNANNGQVFLPSSMNRCVNLELDYNDVDKVLVDVSSPSLGRPISCSPQGTALDPVMLDNGQGYLTCKFDKTGIGGAAYTEQLNIVLDYGYSEYITRDIKIVNVD